MTTITDIKNIYPAATVEQVDSKQLFIVTLPSCIQLLVSYVTIVGIHYGNDKCWLLTLEKFSSTTSKQMTQFRHMYSCINLESDVFSSQVAVLDL